MTPNRVVFSGMQRGTFSSDYIHYIARVRCEPVRGADFDIVKDEDTRLWHIHPRQRHLCPTPLGAASWRTLRDAKAEIRASYRGELMR